MFIATIPTFWLYDDGGKPPNKAPIIVQIPLPITPEIITGISNSIPNSSGLGIANQVASLIGSKFIIPRTKDTQYPTIIPKNIAANFAYPFAN